MIPFHGAHQKGGRVFLWCEKKEQPQNTKKARCLFIAALAGCRIHKIWSCGCCSQAQLYHLRVVPFNTENQETWSRFLEQKRGEEACSAPAAAFLSKWSFCSEQNSSHLRGICQHVVAGFDSTRFHKLHWLVSCISFSHSPPEYHHEFQKGALWPYAVRSWELSRCFPFVSTVLAVNQKHT